MASLNFNFNNFNNPTLVICPGIHSPTLTTSFIQGIDQILKSRNYVVLPTEIYPPYNAIAIISWLKQYYLLPQQAPALSFIAFSAGVVGAMGAAWLWQGQGGKVHNLIAFDGWGMVLGGNFPIYRVSHDHFTHWSSKFLGAGNQGFYAQPEVSHLDLWRSPENCQGWQTNNSASQVYCSLPDFLNDILATFD